MVGTAPPTVSVPDVKTRLRPMGKGVVVMSRRARWLRLLVVLGVVALVAAIVAASGGSIQGGDPRLQGDPQAVVDRDARTGRKAPSAQQRAAARGKTVRWNRFGTPQLLTGDGDYLATGLVSDPVAAARQRRQHDPARHRWFRRCGPGAVGERADRQGTRRTVPAALRRPSGRPRRACRGRRRRGQGRLRVVVTGWRRPRRRASLSPTEAFRRAAASAGRSVGAVTRLGEADGWTVLRADGFASPQRIRLVALPIPGAGAVPAYEAIVLDGAAAEPLGVSVFVDARSGAVLLRRVWSTTRASRPGRSSRRRLPSTTPRPTRASSGAGRRGRL